MPCIIRNAGHRCGSNSSAVKAADLAYLAKVVGIGRQGMSAAARYLRLVSSRCRAAGYLTRAIDAVNAAMDVIAGINKLLSSQCP